MKPFLRWAGGKRWLAKDLAPIIEELLKSTGGKYFEPFLGAGAMYFSVSPQYSVLSDLNFNLIETYKTLSQDWLRVQSIMRKWEVDRTTYYKIRELKTECRFKNAARFIWLNRTCYGGLYRENKKGIFNVPYGGGSRTPQVLYEQELLSKAHGMLKKNTSLICADFEKIIEQAGAGDIVYCDPTYSNVKRDQFDRYGANVYSWSDQVRLSISSERARERGAVVIVSNGYFSDLITLYPNAYRLRKHKTKSIGNKAKASNKSFEYLMVLDPKRRRSLWKKIGKIERKKGRKSPKTPTFKSESEIIAA